MEPIDEEGRDLVGLEDVLQSEHMLDLAEQTKFENVALTQQSTDLEEQSAPNLLME